MTATWNLVLRSCPEDARDAAADFLAKVFAIKDTTCKQIVGATPIQLLTGLHQEEAAAASLAVHALRRCGAAVEFISGEHPELPKIDWPRRPLLFKRDLAEHVADLSMEVPLTGGGRAAIIDLLVASLGASPPPPSAAAPSGTGTSSRAKAFTGVQLPEVTPFGGVSTLAPPPANAPTTTSRIRTPAPGVDETANRLNELFPDDDGGFMPKKDDITSLLNKILPDEPVGTSPSSGDSSSRSSAPAVQSGWSVFLAKIADEARREKAVAMLMEVAKLSKEEADALSKKMIIPVLKGVSQAEAETVKQRFAKAGLLARIKGPE